MLLIYIFAGRIFGMAILLTVRFLKLKSQARQKSLEFMNFQSTDKDRWNEIIEQLTKKKNCDLISNFIDKNVSLYLLEKENTAMVIHSLNNTQTRISTPKRYCQLERKFLNKKIVCDYNLDKASIYYHFEKPYDNFILLMEYKNIDNAFSVSSQKQSPLLINS